MLVITNPQLVFWPGTVTELGLSDESERIVNIGLVSVRFCKLLRGWCNPTPIKKIDDALKAIQSDLTSQTLLGLGVIILAEKNVTLNVWEGFRICNTNSDMLIEGTDDIEIEEWEGVDFPVYVLDKPFNKVCLKSLIKWFSRQTFSRIDVDSESTSFSKHWVRFLDPQVERLLMVPLLGWIDALCRESMSMYNLRLIEVKAYMTPYGDIPTYHKDSEFGPTVTCIIFCHEVWGKDWGGELIIADKDEEPRMAIFPMPGRMVIFRGDLLHKAGVPSSLAKSTRQVIVFRYDIDS